MLSSINGPRKSRVGQTDRLSTQSLQFVLWSEAQVQAWVNWYRDDLDNGGAWFLATWPQPEGGSGVRRFVGAPGFPEYLGPGRGWRVSADVQIRGRGLAPVRYVPLSWNPNDKGARTILSNRNFTSTYHPDGLRGGARATTSRNAGCWYFEIALVGTAFNSQNAWLGVAPASWVFENAPGSDSMAGAGWTIATNGFSYANGVMSSTQEESPYPANAGRMMIAVDIDAGAIYYGADGAWYDGVPEPGHAQSGGPFGTLFPCIGQAIGSAIIYGKGFTLYPPPPGFLDWS